jgi:hypothetical protein
MMHVKTAFVNVFVPDTLPIMSIRNKILLQYTYVYFRYSNLSIICSTTARKAKDKKETRKQSSAVQAVVTYE